MSKIQQLSPHVADLIAAGEVVERPASAAKELVENAMDAGAKHITVDFQNGGMRLLRVTDDGCGMEPEDAKTAFLRHATSKLRTAEDLEAISTLGFRGEALAAISAVSKIDLFTKTAEAPLGTCLRVEAGVVVDEDATGCADGTTIVVNDLFYNTPARMKFMKRDSVESSAIAATMGKLALAHPEVAFTVLQDGQEVLRTAGDGKLYSAIYAVMGKQLSKELLPVDSHWEKYELQGYVTKPTATRGNRANQIFFVNGRYVRSKTMTAALEEAYRNCMMVGRYPSCVLHLRLPEHLVDVNVHPAKTEVKFINEHDLFECVRYGVQGALDKAAGKVEMTLPKQPAIPATTVRSAAPPVVPANRPSAPMAPPRMAPAKPKTEFYRTMTAEDFKAFTSALGQKPAAAPTPDKNTPAPTVEERSDVAAPAPVQQELQLQAQDYRIVGEVLNTYIIVEQGSTVLFIDKHAAHERILFEKLRSRKESVMSQLLLTPILCQPEREETALLLENQSLLKQCGFLFSDYGGGTLALQEIPSDLDAEDAEPTVNALASDLKAGKRIEPEALRDNLLHTIACKAAIKGGWHTDKKEIEVLVQEVLRREDLKYCPHGRPICIELTDKQLQRQFKRA